MTGLVKAPAMISLLLAATGAFGQEYVNLTLEQALRQLQSQGLSILYSSDLIQPQLRVLKAPTATTPRGILEELVRPHGVAVADGPNGTLLLVRAARVQSAPPPAASRAPPDELTRVIVTASRYELTRIPHPSVTSLSTAELQLIPNLGDDPLRTLARLPGTAASDVSAKLNVRGGVSDETLIRFDGLRLANPFHLKDFQSVFSAIDPAVVGTIDVYTGGFPVSFGDRMSGVIDIRPLQSVSDPYREISASLFNASALAAGRFDDERGNWMLSARRGTLDLALDVSGMHLGDPVYTDVYAHVAHPLTPSVSLSANFLQFDDDITLADSDHEEQAQADYRDRYLWLRIDQQIGADASGSFILARSELRSSRSGIADQPGISTGTLDDRRSFTIQSLQADWSWRMADTLALQFGGEWRSSEGRYQYQDEAEFDLVFLAPGASDQRSRTRELDRQASGDQYGVYASMRAQVTPSLIVDAGARWDRSDLGIDDEQQLSPRANVLYRIADDTWLRASWGRFFQTQGINELPISDGATEYGPAQRAEHWLLGVEHRFDSGAELRVEAYHKDYDRLSPRFENLLNTLVILPELKPDRIRIAAPRAVAEGAELSLRSLRTRPMFWWLSYTWSRVEDEYPTHDVRRSWDQTHAFSGGIGWEGPLWELSLAASYHTGWPTTHVELLDSGDDEPGDDEEPGADDEPVALAAPINTQRLQDYLDIDARIARKFPLEGGDSITVFFELSNALNRRNDCCIEYGIEDEPEEGSETPVLEIETLRSLQLLPSVGFIWRF